MFFTHLHFLALITFLGGITSRQSGLYVVVEGLVVDTVEGLVPDGVVVLPMVVDNVVGGGVVGHAFDSLLILHVSLQYAVKHHPLPSVTL